MIISDIQHIESADKSTVQGGQNTIDIADYKNCWKVPKPIYTPPIICVPPKSPCPPPYSPDCDEIMYAF